MVKRFKVRGFYSLKILDRLGLLLPSKSSSFRLVVCYALATIPFGLVYDRVAFLTPFVTPGCAA